MAQGILSKDTELFYNSGTAQTPVWTQIRDLQEVPDMGAAPEKVEVTTLEDGARRYISGIRDYGDLVFTFLYDNDGATSNYRVLKGLEGAIETWKVSLPDGTNFKFDGEVAVIIGGAGVNAALTFTANIALNSDITVSNPA
jgi:hypothetical protein